MQRLSLFLACVLMSIVATAQVEFRGGINYGATYGERQGEGDDKIESFLPDFGYQLGVGGQVARLSETVTVRVELMYELRRSTTKVDYQYFLGPDASGSLVGQLRERYSYLSLPVILEMKFGEVGLYAGPSFSYLVAASRRVELIGEEITIAGSEIKTVDERINLITGEQFSDSAIRRLNAAINVGLSIPITSYILADFRIYHTLTDVTTNGEDAGVYRSFFKRGDFLPRDDYDSTIGIQANLIYRF